MTRESDIPVSTPIESLQSNAGLNLVEVAGMGGSRFGLGKPRAFMLAQATVGSDRSEGPRSSEVAQSGDVKNQTDAPLVVKPESQPDRNKQEERTKLEAQINSQLKGRDLRRVVDDLNTFERRAQSAGVSDAQVADVYFNVSRLLTADASAVIPEKERLRIAQQIIRNSAKPSSIDQGKHGTCNVAVVESRTYTRTPGAAAKVVADVATTGSFITADGTTITPTRRSLIPDDESDSNPPSDGQRGAASHLFQVTAANIHWQRKVVTPDGKFAGFGNIKYEQIPSKRSRLTGDTGERVMDYSLDPPRETTDYKRGPSLSVSDLTDIENQITGKTEKGFVIENKVHGGIGTIHVTSPKELEDTLKNGTAEMPMFIRVHTGNDPFLSDSGGNFSRQRGVWHVVCVTGYDPVTRKASIDNQWGARSDRTVDLAKLYKATMEPDTPEWKKKHEFFINGRVKMPPESVPVFPEPIFNSPPRF